MSNEIYIKRGILYANVKTEDVGKVDGQLIRKLYDRVIYNLATVSSKDMYDTLIEVWETEYKN
jgi:hypothetical protein